MYCRRQPGQFGILKPLEHYSLRRCRIGEIHRCWRKAGARPPKPLGRYQRYEPEFAGLDQRHTNSFNSGGREPLRIRASPRFPHSHTPAGSHRDHLSDPLRELPCQTTSGTEGEQCRRRPRKQANQPVGRPRTQQELTPHDHERILNGLALVACAPSGVGWSLPKLPGARGDVCIGSSSS